ncbi:ATP-binding cassette domain-containing protein [Aureimonas sp. Leaf324]|jgi:iron complex transport system ATP-binding protein|uniref:ABC transporter ATP-binding protein n=1 Tax=Aureimonas sp. Leaf324 TaxID=1736336 RepID=UPI0006F84CD4|nr:ATP-binding cassette domain-containing protein [Aureimonas sp. Leaf324]KQQ79701.1 iron-hydroxamate transporter ATP-binding subunit [Aureimonas sp. Leaf324]
MTQASNGPRTALGYTIEGASFAVAGRTLLHPLDLDLAPGRVVGLVGHNGSGKSTLLKLMARQERPTAGRIRFGTRDLAAWGERDFARHVAYLPQTTPPAPGLTVRDLAALGRYPWHGPFGRFTDTDRARVEAALAATGMLALAERAVDALSGGERQRAWLAMLVAQDAGCLLLDEPISALDVAHQIEVLGLVRSLSRSHGVGVVVVLHDINMAARFCDEIVALKAGRLVARGGPGDVVTAPALEAIYGLPMAILRHPGRPDPVAVPL